MSRPSDTVDLSFNLSLDVGSVDGVGAHLSVSVASTPTDAAREALLDGVEETLVGARGNLVYQAIQQAHSNLEAYGSRHGYSVGSVVDSLAFTPSDASRTARSVSVKWFWTHPAAEFFEFGVSPHTIDGDPLLSFIWEDPPTWVTEEFEQEGDGYRVFFRSVDHPGVPASRAIRDSLNWLRREVGQA